MSRNRSAVDREKSLPQWAQDLLANLRQRTFEAEAARAALDAGHPGSPVSYFDGTRDKTVRLPASATLRVEFADAPDGSGRRNFVEMRLTNDPHEFAVQVCANDSLLIKQHSSNVLMLDIEDRYERSGQVRIRNMGQALLEKADSLGLSFNDVHELLDAAPDSKDEIRMMGIRGRARRAKS